MSLYESGEMYLESILILRKQGKNVRAIDIGEYLGYSKPSVSRAIGILKKSGHVVADKAGYLTLTDTGLTVAEKIFERHRILTEVLISLGVNPEDASDDACKIEHHISDESFEAIKTKFNK
jgi:Mn-dependent DtxR family transcriptional regulator